MKYSFLLLGGALAFASCDNTGSEAVNESTETVGDLGNDIEAGVEDLGNDIEAGADNLGNELDEELGMTSFNETNDAVRNAGGDLTALEPGAAVGVIDGWIAKLDGMDGTGEVTENLRELKAELTSGDIDGQEVGTLLNALGEDTRELGDGNMAAEQLANALAAAGQKLGGI